MKSALDAVLDLDASTFEFMAGLIEPHSEGSVVNDERGSRSGATQHSNEHVRKEAYMEGVSSEHVGGCNNRAYTAVVQDRFELVEAWRLKVRQSPSRYDLTDQ